VAEKPLHIAIDGRELAGKPTGVGRYLTELLRVWSTSAPSTDRYTIVVPSALDAGAVPLGPRAAVHVAPGRGAGTIWEQTRLPRALRELRADVFFAAGYTAPLRLPCPMVVAIYDVSYFAHPEWFRPREGWRRRWLTRSAARRARAIVTISEFSAAEIGRYLGVSRDRIVLAPPGAPAPVAAGHAPGAMAAGAARRDPVVLFVGSLFNRRRIPELLRGFALASRQVPDARLVIVGDNRTSPRVDPIGLATELGVQSRVDYRAYVNDVDLAALYSRARVFAFLSDYEGFAMTPLEAIASGVPPVLQDTAVAREVYADAAVLVPLDAEAIARALVRVLTDEPARAALLAAGRARLASFSWPRTAELVRDALVRAAAG